MRFHQRLLTLLPLLLLLGVLSACANAPTVDPTPTPDVSTSGPQATSAAEPMDALVGDWIVIAVNGNPVATGVVPTLTFNDAGQVTGEGGCNGFGGSYSVDGSAVTFAGITATLIACEDEAMMSQEAAYLDGLQKSSVYVLDGDSLTLTNEESEALVVLRRDDS